MEDIKKIVEEVKSDINEMIATKSNEITFV